MRYKKRKINIKRFSISLSILIILLILTTKISLKHAAENPNRNENISKETPILEETEEGISKEKQLEDRTRQNESDISETKNGNKKEDLKIETNTDDSQKTEDTKIQSEYNKIFQKDLFLGDSITDSLSFYELIDEKNVFARLGFTTKKALDEIEEIINKNPENIYILFGMNDILTFKDSEKFIMCYKELIDTIHDKLPNATIYIQSILPVTPEVKSNKPSLTNENIDIFNHAIKKMAEEENIKYLNIREILENNTKLFEPDGIHVKYKFYELWLEYLTENTK